MKRIKNVVLAWIPAVVLGVGVVAMSAQSPNDAAITADVQHALRGKEFGGVQVGLAAGAVTLNGQVATLEDKLQAEKRAAKAAHSENVDDRLTIASGERVSDQALWQKLSKKLVYDRNGYGTTAFNAIALNVQNGVVTISGLVVEPADKDSALAVIKDEKGVQGLVDHLKVAPLSDFDNRIRFAEARAIYGAGPLNKYAIDPAKPIRIAVENGHVTLVGMVDSKMDRDVAGIRANGVAGVFSVTNNLQVAGQRE